MNGSFWLGVSIGVAGALVVSFTAAMLIGAILHRADMAEPRVWTDEDDELRILFADLNGQQP